MFKVLVLSPLPEGVVRSLFAEQLAKLKLEVSFRTINEPEVSAIKAELQDTDIVIGDYTFKVPITAEMCESMTKVKLIQQPSTGYDHIDVRACKERGIPVANIGGANAISVSEHTIALALILLKRIIYSHEKLVQGEWTQAELMNLTSELNGKTWGIIGLGRIGKEVAACANAFGSHLIYYDVRRLPEEEEKSLGVSFRALPKLLSESDVVSLHTPLTQETRKMLGEREFRTMKPTAVFINTSRGELVDEVALARALQGGWIGGAGVDVFSAEPPAIDHPLVVAARESGNVVLTPHIAGATSDARMRIIRATAENVLRVLSGQKPENVVNP